MGAIAKALKVFKAPVGKSTVQTIIKGFKDRDSVKVKESSTRPTQLTLQYVKLLFCWLFVTLGCAGTRGSWSGWP